MISEDYKEQNRQLHANRMDYGKYGSRWAEALFALCVQLKSQEVLDYGCGKAELNLHLPFGVTNYDPALPKYEEPPEPHDIVACTDVMEHVEPEFTDAVLDDLQRLTKKVCFLNIATREAKKTLPDGRNAHLVVQPAAWWISKIEPRFKILEMSSNEGEITALLEPKR
jgi:hypothetical protein